MGMSYISILVRVLLVAEYYGAQLLTLEVLYAHEILFFFSRFAPRKRSVVAIKHSLFFLYARVPGNRSHTRLVVGDTR